jgi:hypothetical protein
MMLKFNSMETVHDMDKPVWQMTKGELMELLGQVPSVKVDNTPTLNKRLAYGIGGIAKLFNCSMTTANRIKASGRIDRAISQYGRTIVVDADLALALMGKD